MDNKIRHSILKGMGKIVQIGMVLFVCSAVAVGQDRMATLEKNRVVYNGIPITQEVDESTVLNKIISISVHEVPLLETIKKIAVKANLEMVYNSKLLAEKDHSITTSLEQITVAEALWAVLAETSLRFAVSADKQLVLLEQKDANNSHQQIPAATQETVTGTVTDGQSRETLPGVNILVKGTTTGASTDTEGSFELSVPSLQDTLVVSFVGYQTQEVPISGRTEIDVVLQPQAIAGEELVVVGYGTQDRREVTGSISSISGEDVAARTSSVNVTTALQGLTSGVTVSDLGGAPGRSQAQIRIRGVTSLDDNNPLFIVDGVEQSYEDINQNDIESITVLKDASSTAIYGSRAANGVVLITTKRGQGESIQVDLNSSIDFQNLTFKPEHMATEEYLRQQNIAYQNAGDPPIYSEEDIQKYVSQSDPLNYPLPNDWYNIVPRDNAPMIKNSISISGGGEHLSTYASASHFDQQGLMPNTNAQRYQLRLNNDIYVTDYLSFTADLRIGRNDLFGTPRSTPGASGPMRLFDHATQFAVPRYPDGTYGLSPQNQNVLAEFDPDISGGIAERDYYTIGNISGTWDITNGLAFTSRVAVEAERFIREENYPTYQIRDYFNPDQVLRERQINSLTERRDETLKTTLYNTLDYSFGIDVHQFDFLAGYSQETFDYKRVDASGRNLYNNDLRDLSLTESETRDIGSTINDWGLRSFFSRLNYNYDQKYIFEVNLRYDGSSRFPEGSRYSFFPSGSLAWVLSEESFWEPWETTVDEFKIRASWGETGNQNVGLYTYFDDLNILSNTYVFNNNPVTGVAKNSVASTDLRWETTKQLNFGLDVSFLEGKYSVVIDWYRKNTEGILLELPISGAVGLNPAATNAGEVQNTGWEFQIEHRNQLSEVFYSVSFNLSDVRNKVLDLAGTGPYYSAEKNTLVRQVGTPIDALWGYKTDGLLTQEDIDQGYPTFSADGTAGDIKYVDTNNDGQITANDREVIGNTIPRFNFGVNLNLTWKNFDFNSQIQGVGKRDMMIFGAYAEAGSWAGFTPAAATDYWTPENTDARFPRPQKFALKNTEPSEWWIIDGSYIRVKNLQIGYNLPENITDKIGIRNVRAFIGGTNFFTITEMEDWGKDAETPTGRADRYPPAKTYTVGVNVKF
ncbi:TonB-linked outer membrane protein, SusC/RagA family [Fodinibius roseus]|uniref:TonB-linked outer membrane protein, SusC/RagA family n=1 Tax=Fodinibius roseus TaxID=1194090 RepID=A0A1M4UMF8_9BACT|nr:TonB-dependent receptor [Fodinibius roseus]SHE57906.1 TonB-linked outer membrane protein, SusC/RagA family [Fodinibius roseus]